jgi:hypothetical protein
MKPRILAPALAGAAAILLVAGACGTGVSAPTPGTRSPNVPAPGTSAAGAPTLPTRSPDAPRPAFTPERPTTIGNIEDLLVLRMAKPTPSAAFAVIEPVQGQTVFSFPDGVVSHDWRTLASLTAGGAWTRVQVTTPEGGDPAAPISVPGAWRLPTIGIARQASGLSADGSTLVLEEAVDAAPAGPASRTRFAILSTANSKAPRIVSLHGSFAFDALSPGGDWLYLLEYLPGGNGTHYQVRRLDVATGRLQEGSIVDKRNLDERMNGSALTQIAGKSGWVYTLYRGDHGVFIHALDTADGIAVCIDLPGTEGAASASDGNWSLVVDPSGDRLYVGDPRQEAVSAIDLADFTIQRKGELASRPTVRLAKLESAQAAGGRAAVSPDGRTLYVIDSAGVAIVRTADLVTTGHLGGTSVLRSIAVGSAGTVYAVDEGGRVVSLGSGSPASTPVARGTYTSIVAIVPLR